MSTQSNGSPEPGSGCLPVLATFLLVCGLVLLITGDPRGCSSVGGEPTVEQARNTVLKKQLSEALRGAQAAERALDDQNFGAARAALRKAREALGIALFELGDPEKGKGSGDQH